MCLAAALPAIGAAVSSPLFAIGSSLLGAGMNVFQSLSIQKAQNQAARAQAESAIASANQQVAAIELNNQQVQDQRNLDMFERTRQSLRERAKIIVSAGEAGVMGNTPTREQANAITQAQYDKGIIEGNARKVISQNMAKVGGVEAEMQSRVNDANSQMRGYGFLDAATDVTRGVGQGYKMTNNIRGFLLEDLIPDWSTD